MLYFGMPKLHQVFSKYSYRILRPFKLGADEKNDHPEIDETPGLRCKSEACYFCLSDPTLLNPIESTQYYGRFKLPRML